MLMKEWQVQQAILAVQLIKHEDSMPISDGLERPVSGPCRYSLSAIGSVKVQSSLVRVSLEALGHSRG